ncbi:DUF1488 family protein [Caballeronia cordobensis]|uniref:DUF1488 family protein n=1 Tax=Caballeronia cordobensis TaxID=1353886 RepID=UPI002AA2A853|nr:DUF1488 family protein [Caballeronia cordobensis]
MSNTSMKTPSSEPHISADKRNLTFVMLWHGESVTCLVSRTALEAHFWLTTNADDARMLTVFRNGFGRAHAVVSRKLQAHPSKHLEPSPADYAKD